VVVSIGSREWARAVGKSKKEAEQMAAAEAHFKLEGADIPALIREMNAEKLAQSNPGIPVDPKRDG
jgi:hypothetical protein